jgi:hypothetical protein
LQKATAGHGSQPKPKVNLADPYLIAFLRGGKNESLRVVTMSLVDRCLLAASGTKLAATEGAWGTSRSMCHEHPQPGHGSQPKVRPPGESMRKLPLTGLD